MRCCRSCWTLQRLPTIRLAHSRISLGLCCPMLMASFWPLAASNMANRSRANGLGLSVRWLEWFDPSPYFSSQPLCVGKELLFTASSFCCFMHHHPEPQKTFQRQYKTCSSFAHLTKCVTIVGRLLIYQVRNVPAVNVHESPKQKACPRGRKLVRPTIFATSLKDLRAPHNFLPLISASCRRSVGVSDKENRSAGIPAV